ncbi:kinase-like domain-containing protein [Phellopilus nigrolimitatus]|nr:kinase-like domain-containing protein [Phellopilus nigrolimitatus]
MPFRINSNIAEDHERRARPRLEDHPNIESASPSSQPSMGDESTLIQTHYKAAPSFSHRALAISEIILLIFSYFTDTDLGVVSFTRVAPVAVSQVNHQWRLLALSFSSLWASFGVMLYGSYFDQTSFRTAEGEIVNLVLVEKWWNHFLDRSRNADLAVIIGSTTTVTSYGAYGDVYLAKTVSTGSHVAIKVIRRSKLVKESTKALPLTEVQNLRHLSLAGSPFFTQLHESFCDVYNYYIVTDFLHGGTLRDEMTAWGRVRSDRILLIMAQLVITLEQLRKTRIIHRDLKPDNILFDTLGNVTLADLGMSRRFEVQTEGNEKLEVEIVGTGAGASCMTRAGCGTKAYISPEMHRGKGYSFKTDIYSLGVILYEMLFAQVPYPQKELRELGKAVCSGTWSVPEDCEVDPSALDLLRRLLANRPEDRIDLGELKEHTFFVNVDWNVLAARAYDLPMHHAPYLRQIKKKYGIDPCTLIDPTVADVDDAADLGTDTLFDLRPSRPLARRPADPRTWQSCINRAMRRSLVSVVDGALTTIDRVSGRKGRIVRKDWAKVRPRDSKSYIQVRKIDAVEVDGVNEEEAHVGQVRRTGATLSAFDCSIVAIEAWAPPPVEPLTRLALRHVTTRIPARPVCCSLTTPSREVPQHVPKSTGKARCSPVLRRVATEPQMRQPSPFLCSRSSLNDGPAGLARTLESMLPLRTREVSAQTVAMLAVPSLAASCVTLPSTSGPVTPTRCCSRITGMNLKVNAGIEACAYTDYPDAQKADLVEVTLGLNRASAGHEPHMHGGGAKVSNCTSEVSFEGSAKQTC